MSYILDALKKSESERQKQRPPGFADVPSRSRQRRMPGWPWIVGGLLVVNAVVLSSLLLREPAPPPTDTTPPGASSSEASFAEIVREARDLAPPVAEATPMSAGAQASAAPADTARAVPEEPRSAVAVPPAPAMSSQTGASDSAATLPTLMQVLTSGQVQLPDLHLDIHVYSQTPADRFVFINMKKYREAATLAEGPSVREIRADGVVLEHRGTTFLLPRE